MTRDCSFVNSLEPLINSISVLVRTCCSTRQRTIWSFKRHTQLSLLVLSMLCVVIGLLLSTAAAFTIACAELAFYMPSIFTKSGGVSHQIQNDKDVQAMIESSFASTIVSMWPYMEEKKKDIQKYTLKPITKVNSKLDKELQEWEVESTTSDGWWWWDFFIQWLICAILKSHYFIVVEDTYLPSLSQYGCCNKK